MSIISDYLIPTVAIFAFSAASAFMATKSFSLNVFLISMAIGIAILVWIPAFPVYMIIISILILVGLLFKDTGIGEDIKAGVAGVTRIRPRMPEKITRITRITRIPERTTRPSGIHPGILIKKARESVRRKNE